MLIKIDNFISDEQGQSMVEYALIIVFVALAIIVALSIFGNDVKNMYININNKTTL